MKLVMEIIFWALGMGLCVQWVAALFGLVDCRYAKERLYPRVVGNIGLWTGIIAAVALVAGDAYRPPFFWGVAIFPLFHIAAYAGGKAMMSLKTRGQ